MGYFKLVHFYICSSVLSLIVVCSKGSTFHMNSDLLLNSRLGRTSATTDDSEKRSDGKPGMWFGPRLGRSLQKYPEVDINRWISVEQETERNNLERMRKNSDRGKSTFEGFNRNVNLQDLISMLNNPSGDSMKSNYVETSDPCLKFGNISDSSERSFLTNLLIKDCQRRYSQQQKLN